MEQNSQDRSESKLHVKVVVVYSRWKLHLDNRSASKHFSKSSINGRSSCLFSIDPSDLLPMRPSSRHHELEIPRGDHDAFHALLSRRNDINLRQRAASMRCRA